MGATPADTEREIGRLRGDMTDALAELQRRLKGGVRGIAGAEARISTARTQRQLTAQARDNPTLLGEAGVELSRRQLERQIERAKPRGLLLKVEPEDGGYMRVTDARLDVPAAKNKGRQDVIKKLLWAGFLSVFMAVSSVLARRVAGTVWKVTVREDPPTEKPKAD